MQKVRHHILRRGFTLLELAIVLVIIGLISAGILIGTTLIRSAEIRNTISQFNQFDTAVATFKNKYGGLPGDLSNATEYFSGVTDGDGDGRILWSLGDTQSAWQELGLAGLVTGNFTGTGTTLNAQNAPMDRSGNAVYALYYIGDWANIGTRAVFGLAGNYVEILASNIANSLESGSRGVMSPLDVLAMDTKLDDGRPESGKLLGAVGGNPFCIDSSAGYNYSGSYGIGLGFENYCTVTLKLSVQK